jgi:hypothetical protein
MESIKKLFNKNFFLILGAIAGFEILSYFGGFYPRLEYWLFSSVIMFTLFFSLHNIKYGVWIVLLELFIGSQGYLLYFDTGSIHISLRIGLWLIVMSVWLKDFIISIFNKNYPRRSIFLDKKIFSTAYFSYFLILFFFIFAGLINGFLSNNSFQNIFFDFNGWLYFALIFPFYESFFNPVISGDNPFQPVWKILALAATWLSFKTLLFLFFFSHILPVGGAGNFFLTQELYNWVRNTLVGEITFMPSGFIRIFIQSQIYLLIALIIGWFAAGNYLSEIKKNKKVLIFFILAGAFLSAAIITSFSRSFWLALIITFLFYAFWAIKKTDWKTFLTVSVLMVISALFGLSLMTLIIRFPIPTPSVNFNLADALSNRVNSGNEAAVASRYALFPELLKKIQKNLISGGGFGTTVSYHSSDPRILKQNPSGLYTTYAFEWGWLDIWLKLGFFGMIFYLLLLTKLIMEGWRKNNFTNVALSAGILLLILVSIFTPYTNHPLGIGFLIIAAAAIYKDKNSSCV